MAKINIGDKIRRARELSVLLEMLLVNKPYKIKTDRDHYALRYWSYSFDLHQGLLLLLKTGHTGAAFALMRPLVEVFLRLNVELYGTERQRRSLHAGTLSLDFVDTGEQIDKRLFAKPLLGPWFRSHKNTLHGFTHGGMEQLARRSKGLSIEANYPDREVRDVILFTNLFALLTATMVMAFLNLGPELQIGLQLMSKHFEQTRPTNKKTAPLASPKFNFDS